jgi:hypothetical protein
VSLGWLHQQVRQRGLGSLRRRRRRQVDGEARTWAALDPPHLTLSGIARERDRDVAVFSDGQVRHEGRVLPCGDDPRSRRSRRPPGPALSAPVPRPRSLRLNTRPADPLDARPRPLAKVLAAAADALEGDAVTQMVGLDHRLASLCGDVDASATSPVCSLSTPTRKPSAFPPTPAGPATDARRTTLRRPELREASEK